MLSRVLTFHSPLMTIPGAVEPLRFRGGELWEQRIIDHRSSSPTPSHAFYILYLYARFCWGMYKLLGFYMARSKIPHRLGPDISLGDKATSVLDSDPVGSH
jgi:hypothetical protein